KRVFAQLAVPVEVPLGPDLLTRFPPQHHVGAEQGQSRSVFVGGVAGVVEKCTEIRAFARFFRNAPRLLVFSGEKDSGRRRCLFPRPPTGGHLHCGLSHSVSMRRRKSSRTRCTVRSLIPSRSPMSRLESPSAFISRIERFSSGTSSRSRPRTSRAWAISL